MSINLIEMGIKEFIARQQSSSGCVRTSFQTYGHNLLFDGFIVSYICIVHWTSRHIFILYNASLHN
jgi:hypothetical protein